LPLGEMPLRTVKTILHELVLACGADVLARLSRVPDAEHRSAPPSPRPPLQPGPDPCFLTQGCMDRWYCLSVCVSVSLSVCVACVGARFSYVKSYLKLMVESAQKEGTLGSIPPAAAAPAPAPAPVLVSAPVPVPVAAAGTEPPPALAAPIQSVDDFAARLAALRAARENAMGMTSVRPLSLSLSLCVCAFPLWAVG
jgi:hypothetical protein